MRIKTILVLLLTSILFLACIPAYRESAPPRYKIVVNDTTYYCRWWENGRKGRGFFTDGEKWAHLYGCEGFSGVVKIEGEFTMTISRIEKGK